MDKRRKSKDWSLGPQVVVVTPTPEDGLADQKRIRHNRKTSLSTKLSTMCACYHKIHWSVVSVVVNMVSLVLYTTAVATSHWAARSYDTYDVNTGLFTSCSGLNDTCYDTHVFFDKYDEKGPLLTSAVINAFPLIVLWLFFAMAVFFLSEKGPLLASAVINVFALIGMWLFFAMAVFFLCGLFEEKQLATAAIVTSYVSGIVAMIGCVSYAVSIKALEYSLSWSFILAVLGFCVNFAAGVLMCVGRNISAKKRKKGKSITRAEELGPVEEMQMEEAGTTRKQVWSTGRGGPDRSSGRGGPERSSGRGRQERSSERGRPERSSLRAGSERSSGRGGHESSTKKKSALRGGASNF